MTEIKIEAIKGGYILTANRRAFPERELISTTEELFEDLLQIFEGRADCFRGDMYGKVTISREEPKK